MWHWLYVLNVQVVWNCSLFTHSYKWTKWNMHQVLFFFDFQGSIYKVLIAYTQQRDNEHDVQHSHWLSPLWFSWVSPAHGYPSQQGPLSECWQLQPQTPLGVCGGQIQYGHSQLAAIRYEHILLSIRHITSSYTYMCAIFAYKKDTNSMYVETIR